MAFSNELSVKMLKEYGTGGVYITSAQGAVTGNFSKMVIPRLSRGSLKKDQIR